MGNITDAMADCGRARALDPTYFRAYMRMAELLMVRARLPPWPAPQCTMACGRGGHAHIRALCELCAAAAGEV